MKKMGRTELIRYIAETVLTYEKLEVTAHILWDYTCDSSRMISWMCDDRKQEPLIISIRKHGVEIGDKEYVSDRLRVLGQAIHTIEITKLEESISVKDFEVKEY